MAIVRALHHAEVTFYVGPDQKPAHFLKVNEGGVWRGVFETDDEEMLDWFRARPASFAVEEPKPKPKKPKKAPRAKPPRKTKTTDEE